MSEEKDEKKPQTPPPSGGPLSNPQVMAALITGIVTVAVAIVGIVPTILENSRAEEPTAVVIITATPEPTITSVVQELASTDIPTAAPTDAPLDNPTSAPTNAPTLAPTNTPEPTIAPTNTLEPTASNPPNARLIYDSVSFNVINKSGANLSLVGVEFRSSTGFWEARSWGPSVYDRLPNNNCLRMRDAAAGRRNPPAECSNLFALVEVGNTALFWTNVGSFEVVKNNNVVATCDAAVSPCDVYIPQS